MYFCNRVCWLVRLTGLNTSVTYFEDVTLTFIFCYQTWQFDEITKKVSATGASIFGDDRGAMCIRHGQFPYHPRRGPATLLIHSDGSQGRIAG